MAFGRWTARFSRHRPGRRIDEVGETLTIPLTRPSGGSRRENSPDAARRQTYFMSRWLCAAQALTISSWKASFTSFESQFLRLSLAIPYSGFPPIPVVGLILLHAQAGLCLNARESPRLTLDTIQPNLVVTNLR